MPRPAMGRDAATLKHVILSPLVPRYRDRVGLRALDPALVPVARHMAVSNDGRIIYVNNAKAACTSVTSVVFHYTFGRPPEKGETLNNPAFRYSKPYWKENLAALRSGTAFVFTSVRDPLARSLSAFRNFFIDQRNRSAPPHLRAIRRFGFREDMPISKKFDIFLDYAETSLAIDPLHTDQHFRRQVDNVAYDHITFDLIVRVESLAAGLARIPELAGIEDPHSAFVQQPHRNRSNPQDFFPNAEQRARIFSIYRPDYEAFDYAPPEGAG
ncbi:MAG TPA: hypothetical protein ENJ52_14545 [Aliiroseovarius sp.]|nr:hypothetical protein [Aliiroseovarius sp.]